MRVARQTQNPWAIRASRPRKLNRPQLPPWATQDFMGAMEQSISRLIRSHIQPKHFRVPRVVIEFTVVFDSTLHSKFHTPMHVFLPDELTVGAQQEGRFLSQPLPQIHHEGLSLWRDDIVKHKKRKNVKTRIIRMINGQRAKNSRPIQNGSVYLYISIG